MPKKMNLIGESFGKLKVIEDLGTIKINARPRHYWLCKCECGKTVQYPQDVLRRKTYPVKSCGCNQYKIGDSHPGWTGHGEISGGRWDCIKRERTGRKKIKFSITIQEAWNLFLKQNRKCALSGLDISFGKTGKSEFTASLDRIDSSKGYISSNIQWIHKDINWMKNRFSQQHFIEMCRRVANYADFLVVTTINL